MPGSQEGTLLLGRSNTEALVIVEQFDRKATNYKLVPQDTMIYECRFKVLIPMVRIGTINANQCDFILVHTKKWPPPIMFCTIGPGGRATRR